MTPYICEELRSKTTQAGYLQLLPGVHKTRWIFPGKTEEDWIMEKTDIKSLNYEELQEFIKETGEKAFRGKTDLPVDA